MLKGIYISLSGAVLQQARMDISSQNLANADTVGYKKDGVGFRDYLISDMNGIPEASENRAMSFFSGYKTDYSDGTLLTTGNPFHVAIEGKGFFSLEGDKYTRRGDLRLNSDGFLVNHHGVKVMGKGGPIQIFGSGDVGISSSGELSVNGVPVDTLKVVEFRDESVLSKFGDDAFLAAEKGVEAKAQVRQGVVETSNVDVIREMIGMITLLRQFQAHQKAIQLFDDATGKVINEIGRI